MKNILLESFPPASSAHSKSVKLIVDFGHAQTATIHERDVVKD